MKSFVICAAIVLTAASLPLPACAQDASAATAEDGLRQELVRLNRSIEEILALLKKSMERQELELLIKRVELATRKLTPLEEELRRLQNSLEGLEEEQLRMEAMKEQLEEHLVQESVTREEAAAYEQQLEQVELHLKLVKDQSWKKEQRTLDLEGRIATVLEDVGGGELGGRGLDSRCRRAALRLRLVALDGLAPAAEQEDRGDRHRREGYS